jgi:DNA-directed RNA polymerase subunit omega
MARVTIGDCLKTQPDRFELVILASQRARQLSAGATTELEGETHKKPVIALREMARDMIECEALEEAVTRQLQKHLANDEEEFLEETDDFSMETQWAAQMAQVEQELTAHLSVSNIPSKEEISDDSDTDSTQWVQDTAIEIDPEI